MGDSANADERVDFNREIRPILSNRCFTCHGPDEGTLESGLRLDQFKSATAEADSGERAIVPGNPEASELLRRVAHDDESMRMPPLGKGEALTASELELLRRWIEQGAEYSLHWSYERPRRPDLPSLDETDEAWTRNAIDHFVIRRMRQHGLSPQPAADRYALGRRVYLDLTGLPPTLEQLDAFVEDTRPDAYERLVDSLLQSDAYGEHWARKWLDLARYADSAGYADDPPRTIWAYRDWVIRAFNDNLPFDQFTTHQLAGDLLPNPTQDQLIATAFHRNTLTNNEGGTQDEEFRNVAVVDRVNTTLSVWMGTTIGCAQCHSHKYDPITQEEYFELFAIFNNSEDADRRNEAPTIDVFSKEGIRERKTLLRRVERLRAQLSTSTPELEKAQQDWEASLALPAAWRTLHPTQFTRESGQAGVVHEDGTVVVTDSAKTDRYQLSFAFDSETRLTAIQLNTLPHDSLPNGGSGLGGGNFVITEVTAELIPRQTDVAAAKYLRITNRGKNRILSLAEVEVFSSNVNIAPGGQASQHSTEFDGAAELAIDQNTTGDYDQKSVTHTAESNDPWWELELAEAAEVDRIVIWNRTDNQLQQRLKNFDVELLDADRTVVWTRRIADAPDPELSIEPSNRTELNFDGVTADYHQPQFEPDDVLHGKTGSEDGWAIGGQIDRPHKLTLRLSNEWVVSPGATLVVSIAQESPHDNHLLGRFQLAATGSMADLHKANMPRDLRVVLQTPVAQRSALGQRQLAKYFREEVATALAEPRRLLKESLAALDQIHASTSVPVMRELTKDRRQTWLQYRGSYLAKGPLVTPGTPDIFRAETPPQWDRLALARWLVSPTNPLTSRVLVNRYWETLFGRGIVATSEEFGSQGELPTHPELLDWLAVEVQETGWDLKALLRLLVTSATYRQAVRVEDQMLALDPDNRWLSRGPRVRHSAEMIRDQALLVSGLLSQKMYGPPVKPPQPEVGLRAAFGGSTDWKPSEGEDRYRRAIYTTWRRSNPYPSMATFDAPNREVCTIRRNRTNTPLQSLVTLNDPVYVEAAQALGRRMLKRDGSHREKLEYGLRLAVGRPARPEELLVLERLLLETIEDFSGNEADAKRLATEPLGELPSDISAVDAAAMTVVANVILNLDEMFMKR